MAEPPTLPEICQALRIEPGQTLIVRLNPDRFLSREQFNEFADRLKAGAPDIKLLLVAADEIAVIEAGPDDSWSARRERSAQRAEAAGAAAPPTS